MRVSASCLGLISASGLGLFGWAPKEAVVLLCSSHSDGPRSGQTSAESRDSRKISLSGLLLGFPWTSFALRRLRGSRRFLSRFLPRFSPGLRGLFSCPVRSRVAGMWGSDVAQRRQVSARFSRTGSQVPGKVGPIFCWFLWAVRKVSLQLFSPL